VLKFVLDISMKFLYYLPVSNCFAELNLYIEKVSKYLEAFASFDVRK